MKRYVLSARDAAVLGFVVTTTAVVWLWGMTHRVGDVVFVVCPGVAFHYTFSLSKLYPAPLLFVGIFLFTALPEEFLFRGLIQNWIERVTKSAKVGLVVAALIFGAAHLNNGLPIPNYRYFMMASVAGIFYGWAWRATGSLMASSLTHALVDTLWSVFFR